MKHVNKKHIISVIFSVLFIIASFGLTLTACSSNDKEASSSNDADLASWEALPKKYTQYLSEPQKIKISGESLYAMYSLDEIYDRAHTVVRGVVKSKGEGFADEKYSDPWWILTPVNIKVKKVYKGENVPKTVTYNERGGECGWFIFESGDPILQKGEEIIIFLYGDDNQILTSDALYHIKNGKVTVSNYTLGNADRLKGEKGNVGVRADVKDFEKLIESLG